MEKDPALEFGEYALRRMCSRGLTQAHVWYCVVHHTNEYKTGTETVWQCKLPDGRNIKIRVRDGSARLIYIVDAFTFI